MAQHQLITQYEQFNHLQELDSIEQNLVQKAIEARRNAYAPYSDFQVGAALLLDNQIIVVGNNQENAAYPSGMCAERVAMFYANSQYPGVNILKIAIAAGRGETLTPFPITPCGSCRQVMVESEKRQQLQYDVILVGDRQILKIKGAATLLPFEFNSEALNL
jgi:cytidine deaminase